MVIRDWSSDVCSSDLLSYTISGGLGVLTNYGIDLKVNMEVDTDTTYGVVVKGGISGKAFELMEYVAA